MEKQKEIILRRFLNGVYTQEEASRVFRYLTDPGTYSVFDDLASGVWEESDTEKHLLTDNRREEYKKEARRLLDTIERRKKRSWYRFGAIAASIAVCVVVVYGAFHFISNVFPGEVVYVEAVTSYGEKKQLLLPDGTQLILNSCSSVRYPKSFSNHERQVGLEGEGYFKVAYDENRPFVIHTSRLDVKVLGTSFNVKSYETDEIVSVNVESGKVQVDLPAAAMQLVANERIFVNTISDEYSKQKDTGQVAAWIKGSLHFRSTPVRDVAKVLERTYNCRITFAPGQAFDNLISGEHDNKDLESVLKAIEYTSNIKYRREGRNILLYKQKPPTVK